MPIGINQRVACRLEQNMSLKAVGSSFDGSSNYLTAPRFHSASEKLEGGIHCTLKTAVAKFGRRTSDALDRRGDCWTPLLHAVR